MAYTKLWDVVQDQLWSFQDANRLKGNYEYVADFLNLGASETSGYAPGISLNNDITDGGAIYFDGGTSAFLKCNAAGSAITAGTIASQSFDGDFREVGDNVIIFWHFTESGLDRSYYMSNKQETNYTGQVMPYPGTVLVWGWTGIFSSYVGTPTTVRADLRKNGASFIDGGTAQATNSGRVGYQSSDLTWNSNTFAAGDFLDARYTHVTAFSSTGNAQMCAWAMVSFY